MKRVPEILKGVLFLSLGVLTGCGQQDSPESVAEQTTKPDSLEKMLFSSVPASKTGISFTNIIDENPEQNYFKYEYIYNGGGVAIGDINNDGLQDIYFTGNLVSDKLYLNKGGLQFEDITKSAIPEGAEGWHSGVTMADVNDDGFVDIYVCRAGWYEDPELRKNLLYINNGDMTFTEKAEEYGLADTTRSTQAAFFDFDRDGDLDLYVMNTPLQGDRTLSNIEVKNLIAHHRSPSDRLYMNEGGKFNDITAKAGLWNMGYGLGLSVSDLDGNGYPDIYIANDYIERDNHYRNEQGEFTDVIHRSMRHISNFGMGCDAADINNDGLTDLLVVDMVSEDHVRSKKNMGAMNRSKFWLAHKAGYHLQYMFNTLQLNNGNGTYSEIANMAGISKTDWSWAPLFADFDNDGYKDLLVTNGYKRDMRDNDYMKKANELSSQNATISFQEVLSLVPTNKIKNYLYRNNGDLTFKNVSDDWGFRNNVNSNGAAYADLDNDGDLDLVINNMDSRAELYENNANTISPEKHFIQVKLADGFSHRAQGAKVTLHTDQGIQYQELIATRGYQSSMSPVLHFGIGEESDKVSVSVQWPDGMVSEFSDLEIDRMHEFSRTNAQPAKKIKQKPLLAERDGSSLFKHQENEYDDFEIEVLLPHKLSELGPHLSTGDVNGDGNMDVFVGGARGQSGALLLGTGSGTFRKSSSEPWRDHASREDLGSHFFDADGDKDLDLYVVSGSNEVDMPFDRYNDRLYVNDGNGNFSDASGGLPPMQTSAQRVVSSDFDGDGDMDLFVGGRGIPGQYPKPPRSYLLRNDGTGRFADATEDLAPDLINPGLVTDAVFTDHDGDGDEDLFVVGEWMALSLYEKTDFGFARKELPELKDSEGWWMSISAGDLDGDGDEDLIAGNIGLNNKFHPSIADPLHVYWNDFDNNGKPDIVLAKEKKETLLPVRGRECSSEQCPMILDKFPTYDAFANASLEQVYGVEKLKKGLHFLAKDFHSYILINTGNGHYEKRVLPNQAQMAPIMGSDMIDVNKDGVMDLVIAGNMWGAEVETVRYDAGNGLILLGDAKEGFSALSIAESGFFAAGNVKDLKAFSEHGNAIILVANNNGPLQLFRSNSTSLVLSTTTQ